MLTGSDILIYRMLITLLKMRLNTTIQMEKLRYRQNERGKKLF